MKKFKSSKGKMAKLKDCVIHKENKCYEYLNQF